MTWSGRFKGITSDGSAPQSSPGFTSTLVSHGVSSAGSLRQGKQSMAEEPNCKRITSSKTNLSSEHQHFQIELI
jgi:hypothetical protein